MSFGKGVRLQRAGSAGKTGIAVVSGRGFRPTGGARFFENRANRYRSEAERTIRELSSDPSDWQRPATIAQAIESSAVELERLERALIEGSNGELAKAMTAEPYRGYFDSYLDLNDSDEAFRNSELAEWKNGQWQNSLTWGHILQGQRAAERWMAKNLPGAEGESMRALLGRREQLIDELARSVSGFGSYTVEIAETLRRRRVVEAAGRVDPALADVAPALSALALGEAEESLQAIRGGIDEAYYALESGD